MSACDEDILLLSNKEWCDGRPRVAGRDDQEGDFSDDDNVHANGRHLASGFKRQLEMGGEYGMTMPKSGASSEGSERDQDNSDDVKGPKRLKGMQGDSFKKDREEWSDTAIDALLDAYTEKFVQLNKGNLRGRHWEEVSNSVSMRCQGQKSAKTIEQCKNKVDSLKKRHKVERHRMEQTGSTASQWPWFMKVEKIVGSAPKLSVLEEDSNMAIVKSAERQRCSSSSAGRQKRASCRTQSMSPGTNHHHHLLFATKAKLLQPKWQRVVLKVSGEALAGDRMRNNNINIDEKITMSLVKEVASASRLGIEIAVVVGGGNFFRGSNWTGAGGVDRASADHIGMLATMMNALFLQASLEGVGMKVRVQSSYNIPQIADTYMSRKAIRELEKRRIVIFGGGTGNPFFTTDTAAAVRAAEINAEVVLKACNVDGVFDCESKYLLEHVSYREGLGVMDAEAINHCQQHNLPVVVFNLNEPGNVLKALTGERIGTLIDDTGSKFS